MKNLSGKVVRGYELRELIGIGGFGVVYSAYQSVVDREVAIKIILPEYANQAHFIRNFEIEAQIIARLEHLHIVPLYDFWREPSGAYIIMRLLKGGSLQQSLKTKGAWSLDSTARLLDQIASALTIAHRNGVIHQDLKAANILLDEERNAYLTDFGIAKDLTRPSEPDPESDVEDILHGSPEYMAPEQILRSTVDVRTDIYSLGILLFEILTGAKPFLSSNDDELVRKQLYDPIPRLQEYNPELPEALNVVIQRATNKAPRERYNTPMMMADNFRQFVDLSQKGPEIAPPIAEPEPPVQRKALEEVSIEDLMFEPPNPYKGLRAFQEADSADFFGRDELIELLFQRIRGTGKAAQGGGRFLAVVGPSGSGKSSVVKAGLIPQLRQNSWDWYVAEITPGEHPLQEIEAALFQIAQDENIDLAGILRESESGLLNAVEAVFTDTVSELVLVIDQFEETFTMVSDEEERRHFLNSLLHAVMDEKSRIRIVITLRADFYDRPLLYSEFGEMIRQRTEVVLPLNADQLAESVVKPAQRVGLELEDGLVDAIIADVSGQPGTLPLLQYALTELFSNRRGKTLTLKAYRESGGVSGAMTRRADEIFIMMSPESKTMARQIFLRLVTLGEGTEDTRRRALLSDLLSLEGDRRVIQQVLDVFGKRRLLFFDNEPKSRAPTVEIAHEALIKNWMQLREWLNENRVQLRVHRQLSLATQQWLASDRDGSYLATGARLVQLETLIDTKAISLNKDERDYLHASMLRRERENQRRNLVIAGLFIFSLFALSLALFAFDGQSRARAASNVALSRELALQAVSNLHQLDLAALLSVEAYRAADTVEAQQTLLQVIASGQSETAHIDFYLEGHAGDVRSLAYSPDGRIIASGSQDGRVRLWDAASLEPLRELQPAATDQINTIAFSPDSRLLAAAGDSNAIYVFDVQSGEPMLEPMSGHESGIWDLSFNPDASMLASGSGDGSIRLWNLLTGEMVGEPIIGHNGAVYGVDFSPTDPDILASGGADNRVLLWNLASEDVRAQILDGHVNWVRRVRFSPDGTRLLSASNDTDVIMWDVTSGSEFARFTGHRNEVRDVVWSPDGDRLASVSLDGLAILWDAENPAAIDILRSPAEVQLLSAAFAPNGPHLVIGGRSNDVMVWNLSQLSRAGRALIDHERTVAALAFDSEQGNLMSVDNDITNQVTENTLNVWDVNDLDTASRSIAILKPEPRLATAIAFSPDQSFIATASLDDTLLLSDPQTGELIAEPLVAGTNGIFSLAFNQAGDLMATGGGDGNIRLWDRNEETWTPREALLDGHENRVFALDFSPDGRTLLSGGRDSTVILWNIATGEQIGDPLTEHDGPVISVAFSSDGTQFASGSRGSERRLILWETDATDRFQLLNGHNDWANTLDFSANGRWLASGSRDETVILWDLTAETVTAFGEPLRGHTAAVNAVAFGVNDTLLASAGDDTNVVVWQINPEIWPQFACGLANRDMNVQEWSQYMHETPYRRTCEE